MSAVKIEDAQANFRSNRLGRSNDGLLIDTLQIVEPRRSFPVPNHLLESKIYSKLSRNNVVQARPSVVHFSGFELNKVHRLPLELANISPDVLRMHVIPPQTRFFSIKYKKKDRLVPGLTLDVTVEFKADEWRYYYDCIRIHTPGEENLVIPVHAYPVLNLVDFPSTIRFPSIPVGESETKIIPLECNCPIEFEYHVVVLQSHSAFKVEPMSGVVAPHSSEEINVTFSPIDFSTAMVKVQVTVSQFNAKPLICTVYGKANPGLLREKMLETYESDLINDDTSIDGEMEHHTPLDLEDITPLGRVRKKREKTQIVAESTSRQGTTFVERDGLRFGENLDNIHAINMVLNQEAGKLSMNELRQAISAKAKTGTSRQMKEAAFEKLVLEDIEAEKRNKFKWQVHVGKDALTPEKKINILTERRDAWSAYKLERGDPVLEHEYSRIRTKCTFSRNTRDFQSLPSDNANFDVYSNDTWAVRHSILSKFQQAARKILIRKRCEKKLKSLQSLFVDWKDGKYAGKNVIGDRKETEKKTIHDDIRLSIDDIKSVSFPTYIDPTQKDDLAVDSLGIVPVKETEVVVKSRVPYHPLKVPQQYKLLQYIAYNIHEVGQGYVSPNQTRQFRTGAEDEVIILSDSDVTLVASPEPPIEEKEVLEDIENIEEECKIVSEILLPPTNICRNPKYDPMYVFNPVPGMLVRQQSINYSEVDGDFHLCPIPLYPTVESNSVHNSTRKAFLDRKETIKASMTWRKFPSQGLTSLSSTPTLTSVWVPRWTDPFSRDLLPKDTPPILDRLQPEDVIEEQIAIGTLESSIPEEDACPSLLTMEMVKAQFPSVQDPPTNRKQVADDSKPPTTMAKQKEDAFPFGDRMPPTNIPVSQFGYVQKEKREEELDYFLTRKYDQLGKKIRQRTEKWKEMKKD